MALGGHCYYDAYFMDEDMEAQGSYVPSQGHAASASPCLSLFGLPSLEAGAVGSPPRGVRGRSEDSAGASVQPIPELPLPSGRTTGHLLPAPPAPLSRFPGREPGTLPWWSRRAQQSVPEPPWRPRSPGQLQLLPGAPSHVVSEASAPAPPAPPKNEPV